MQSVAEVWNASHKFEICQFVTNHGLDWQDSAWGQIIHLLYGAG